MSILPSLLTSATATPSERNFLSMTVFFQRIGPVVASSLPAEAGTHSSSAGSREAAVRHRRVRMGRPRCGRGSGTPAAGPADPAAAAPGGKVDYRTGTGL